MRLLTLLLALLALPAAAQPLRFIAFGDMPYCRDTAATACAVQLARVETLVEVMNAQRPALSIFLGDTKGGNESCADTLILRTLDWFGRIEGPLVYTPGDNEWTDCWYPNSGPERPLDRLRLVRERFFPAPQSLGRAPMPLQRQGDLSPEHRAYVENARWSMGGLRFVTLHIVGSNNNLPAGPGNTPPTYDAAEEFRDRNRANLAWLEEAAALAEREHAAGLVVATQADMYCYRREDDGFAQLRRALVATAQRLAPWPVLLLNGDSHFFLDQYPEPAAPNLRRLMVPGDQDVRAVLVTFTAGAADPFRFEAIGLADRPALARCPGRG